VASALSLSVVMPVYNERATIETAIERVLAVEVLVDRLDLVVVDDGSTDGTRELLDGREWPENVRILRHDRNRGKGAALRTALAQVTSEYCTVLDADLEYDPSNFNALLVPLLAGDADAVYGIRGFQAHSAYSFWYVIGNKAVTLAANLLYNAWLADLMTCQKMLKTSLFRALPLHANGFAIEAEITARLFRAGARIFEVPITYRARRREEGKKLTPVDGLKVLATLARCRIG
jgi:glycosyltransferase involved in cell wall biosynthesis